MSNWKTAAIKPGETGNVIFALLLDVNENKDEQVSFGASSPKLNSASFNRVQELAMELMEVIRNG